MKLSDKEFRSRLDAVKSRLQLIDGASVEEKAVNYGSQFMITRNGRKAVVTIYNGKKGWRPVFSDQESPLGRAVFSAVSGTIAYSQEKAENTALHESMAPDSWGEGSLSLLADQPAFNGTWAGSDESGKGDFIGPLVVAAVVLDVKGASFLRSLGVRDSKAVRDSQIRKLAPEIWKTALARSVRSWTPDQYNAIYPSYGNLNPLLADAHIAVMKDVLSQCPECHCALIDQFSRRNRITETLEAAFPEVSVFQRPKGEDDVAVAAASILARAGFLKIMEQLSEEAGVKLPFGGGSEATEAARRISEKQGRDVLSHFVKVHFANYRAL
jgi:ribonuclease HIII